MTSRPERDNVDAQLSEALIVYYGGHRRSGSFPADVIAQYGQEIGSALIERIRLVEQDAFSAPPNWEVEDLGQAAARVREAISIAHPELSTDAVKTVGNYFSFEWK